MFIMLLWKHRIHNVERIYERQIEPTPEYSDDLWHIFYCKTNCKIASSIT